MRIQKLISAFTALCLASGALISMPATQASAADETLTFDIQCAQDNRISIDSAALAEGDVEITISIFIPENPGVNAISLKLQVNDGEVAEDGSFGNYGFQLKGGKFAAP